MFSSVSIPVPEANSTRLPLKGPLRRTRPRSLIRLADTDDDDAIVVIDFQQLLGLQTGYRFDIWIGSDRKSLEIKRLELVAQIFPRWNPLTSWMRQIEDFQRAA